MAACGPARSSRAARARVRDPNPTMTETSTTSSTGRDVRTRCTLGRCSAASRGPRRRMCARARSVVQGVIWLAGREPASVSARTWANWLGHRSGSASPPPRSRRRSSSPLALGSSAACVPAVACASPRSRAPPPWLPRRWRCPVPCCASSLRAPPRPARLPPERERPALPSARRRPHRRKVATHRARRRDESPSDRATAAPSPETGTGPAGPPLAEGPRQQASHPWFLRKDHSARRVTTTPSSTAPPRFPARAAFAAHPRSSSSQ